jgi:hypothetical protein
MTILVQLIEDGDDPELNLTIQRNYEEETTKITINNYGATMQYEVNTPQLQELLKVSGLA